LAGAVQGSAARVVVVVVVVVVVPELWGMLHGRVVSYA